MVWHCEDMKGIVIAVPDTVKVQICKGSDKSNGEKFFIQVVRVVQQ